MRIHGPIGYPLISIIRAAHHRYQAAQSAAVHDPARLGHDRTVGSMMADQDTRSVFLSLAGEGAAFGDGRCLGLFKQHRQPGGHAYQRVGYVKLIGRGEHDTIWAIVLEQVFQRFIERRARVVCQGLSRGGGVDYCTQLAGEALTEYINAGLADITSAGQGDTGFGPGCRRCQSPKARL